MTENIILAIISAVSAISVALISGLLVNRRNKKKVDDAEDRAHHAERELEFQTKSLGFDELEHIGVGLNDAIEELMDTSSIDRVLRLKAWNGEDHMKFVSAYRQQRKGSDVVEYMSYPVDQDYYNRLTKTRQEGHFFFPVVPSLNSSIMDSYIAEGLKGSLWVYGTTIGLKGSPSRCIFFMSFASHSDSDFSHELIQQCMRVAERHAYAVREYYRLNPETEVIL